MKIGKLICFLAFLCVFTACTKEVEQPIDELQKTKQLHYGTWVFYQHEIETYSGTTQTGKKLETFSNYTVEWKKDGTYLQFRNGTTQTGTWDLTSPSVFVYDKNSPENERYYYIQKIDSNFYSRKGPFKKNGGLYTTYLTTEYYHK